MKKKNAKMLNESKADIMARLAAREDLMDNYASLYRGASFIRGKNGMMKEQDPNERVMDEVCYDCQQKYGFCERPTAMKALVRDYLMPTIQKIAKEKYGYNGPVWPSKDEQKASDNSRYAEYEQKLQDANAMEQLTSNDANLYWTGFSFLGMKGLVPKAAAKEKRDAIENVLRKIGVYMSPDIFLKTDTGKKFLKMAKKFYETHSYDFQSKSFVEKQPVNESRKIQITEADMRWMVNAIRKKNQRGN